MVRLVTVHVPVLQNHDFLLVLAVEEDPVAPGRRPLRVVDLLPFYVFVGGEEVDVALAVDGQHARFVVEVVLVLLQQGLQVRLHVGLGQFLLGVHLLNRVENFSHVLVLGLESEVHVADEEAVLTLIEEPAFVAFV